MRGDNCLILVTTVAPPTMILASTLVESSSSSSLTVWSISNIIVGFMVNYMLYSLNPLMNEKWYFFGDDNVGGLTSSNMLWCDC